jgi:hypothetical protein
MELRNMVMITVHVMFQAMLPICGFPQLLQVNTRTVP